jgi:hypothetical protein
MTVKTEGQHAGEFLISEASGTRSRESITVTGGSFPVGQVLGKITASGKYTAYDAAVDPADGSETAVAVLFDAVDASSADAKGVAIMRDAEVRGSDLTDNDASGTTDLAAAGIIVR